MLRLLVVSMAICIVGVQSQSLLYGQCGGIGWAGAKTCVSGSTCIYSSPYYSQCLPSGSGSSSTSAPTTAAPTTAAPTTAAPTTAATTQGAAASGSCPSTWKSKGSNFIQGKFKLGIDYNFYTKNTPSLTQFDYITIWMNTIDGSGSTAWNPWYQGAMLNLTISNNKIPVFYAYVIAFEARAKAGLQDCDSGLTPTLCVGGANFIRNNRAALVGKYTEHATNIAKLWGTTKPIVFIMEPDFWQYYGDSKQQGGGLDGTYMASLFNDFVSAIKAKLPNALISWDISAWIGQSGFQTWWCFFKDSQIDFIHTSGGQARGDSTNIKQNELTWSFVSSTTGKKIIADCGYGANGAWDPANCQVWTTTSNENARIADGVVALSETAIASGTIAKPSVTV